MVFSRERKEIHLPPHYTPDHPDPATPKPEEMFANQQLRDPLPHRDDRPLAVRKSAPNLVPELNRMYGSGRSAGDWRYFIDNYAVGTLTTVLNTTVTTAIKLTNQPNARLLQWPFAVQFFLVIRKFSMAAQSAITTVGAIDVQFNDIAGNIIPMGDFINNSSISYDVDSIIPTAIVDPGQQSVGNLLVALNGTSSTVSVYNYQIGFSYCYLLPNLDGYSVQPTHRVLSRKDGDI